MNERELEIPLHDGKIAYGKLAGEWYWPLIIFIHGLAGHAEEVLPYTAARYFAQNGYSFLRFDLYGGRTNGRRMSECDLNTHAEDVNAIVHFAKQQGASQIYLVGHSLGAYTLAMANKQPLSGLILWEPSHPTDPPISTTRLPYIEQLQAYLADGTVDHLLTERYTLSVGWFNLANFLNGWTLPTLIVYAAKSGFTEAGGIYESILRDHAPIYRARDVEGADHSFTADGWKEVLFARTLQWLQLYRL